MDDTTMLEKETAEVETQAARFNQADLDRIIKDRLERDRQAREKAYHKGRQEAEEAWQSEGQSLRSQLEEQRQRLAELESLGEKAEKLGAALKGLLDEQKKTLPKALLPLLEKLDEVEQLNYITNHRAELGLPGISGIPASPAVTSPGASLASQTTDQDGRSPHRGQASLYEHF